MARTQQVIYTARGGETLCHVAAAYGFPNCEQLRAANDHLAEAAILRRNDRVTIPPQEEGADGGPDRSNNRFRRPNFPPPNVWFIKETGAGYPDPEPDPTVRGYDPHYPASDPRLRQLAVSNYHIDQAGDGTDAFATDAVFAKDNPSSQDPDHFKIQVYDNKVPDGVDDVHVTLYAMRPGYRRNTRRGVSTIEWTANYYYPTTDDRKLENLICRRVGRSNYFRSAYLRLVATEEDRAARPTQTLLVKDYYDDGADDDQKRFTEILHHRVRVAYDVQMCSEHKCRVLKDCGLPLDAEVRLAVHLMHGSSATDTKAREQIYKWMRRTLAQTGVRPHLKLLHEVEVPKNMITVADGDGKHASGKDSSDNQSEMTVTIRGTDYTIQPRRGDSPQTTANRLKALLVRNHFQVRGPFRVRVSGLTPISGEVSAPSEILVFDRDGNRVIVESVAWTDVPNAAGKYGQTLTPTTGTDVDNFHVDWPYQPRDARSMYYNYRVRGLHNIFVCGDNLIGDWDGGTLYGLGPYGGYGGGITDIGPVTFLCEAAMDAGQKPFNPTHEIFHPLMHVCHTSAAGTEVMCGHTSTADSKDATKRVADAPIAVTYQTLVGTGQEDVILNGERQTLGSGARLSDTPVQRFKRVGRYYGTVSSPTQPRADQG